MRSEDESHAVLVTVTRWSDDVQAITIGQMQSYERVQQKLLINATCRPLVVRLAPTPQR